MYFMDVNGSHRCQRLIRLSKARVPSPPLFRTQNGEYSGQRPSWLHNGSCGFPTAFLASQRHLWLHNCYQGFTTDHLASQQLCWLHNGYHGFATALWFSHGSSQRPLWLHNGSCGFTTSTIAVDGNLGCVSGVRAPFNRFQDFLDIFYVTESSVSA